MKVFALFIDGNKRYLPILSLSFDIKIKDSQIFLKKAVEQIKVPIFDIVSSIKEASFLLIPYDYFSIEKNREYLKNAQELSVRHNKKILIFDYSDFDRDIDIKNSLIFRVSQYKYKKKKNEFIIPPLVEDLGKGIDIFPRKKSEKPIVGFTGWADFPNLKQRIKYEIKNFILNIKSLWNSHAKVHKQGIYFRRQAIRTLEKNNLIKINFILRKSYSGHLDTISFDPELARKEFIENIINSDFILTPKGDGNYSNRFYEVLSLGRIPILINTDMVLPFEDRIDYNGFILRVKYQDINKLDKIILEFYKSLTSEEFVQMQKNARKAFLEYFIPSSFYQNLFKFILKE